ncbi:MAG: ABC transporter ATP-binding protein [Oscillospiraceae bacterium]|nr:ABC transporter ATP-binding protein [Oscillospiraceae bacterium]
MILCQQLTKNFDETKALDGICVSIQKGSIYGLVGSNGAGKSTLMRIIAGILKQDDGSITVDGLPVWEDPDQKSRVFLVADEPYFVPQATLDSMAAFYRRFYPDFDRDLYERLCAAFALPRRKRIATFSKGMKRQAAFLLGMSVRPDYLMLDECFDGLDPVKRQVVRKVISDTVAEREMTVIISSHNLRELDEICDTVGILHKGTLLYSKDLDDLKGEVHKLQAVFMKPVTEDDLKNTLNIMAMEQRGKFWTLIVRGDMDSISETLAQFEPAAVEAYPLTLEEVFLYEMEVKGYDANVIFQ